MDPFFATIDQILLELSLTIELKVSKKHYLTYYYFSGLLKLLSQLCQVWY
jgi:hypothetical protein